eukprot:115581-Chlamydomonas_euryale.AAC.3
MLARGFTRSGGGGVEGPRNIPPVGPWVQVQALPGLGPGLVWVLGTQMWDPPREQLWTGGLSRLGHGINQK